MSRYSEMNDFIIYLASLVKKDPRYMFSFEEDKFYGELVRVGLSNEQKQFNVRRFYDKWIEKFKEKDNIKVFVSDSWSYWCQFTNGDEEEIKNEKSHIKMYVPFRPDTIYNGVNILFNFLAANNIKHISKVGEESRVDGVVIRVTSKEDALKIAKFIEATPYLKNGLYKPNPFLLNDGNIAYATDARFSFNEELSIYLREYIGKCYNNGTIDSVNIKDFFFHILSTYSEVFCKGNQEKLKKYATFRDLYLDDYCYEKLAEISQVDKLILYSLCRENKLDRVLEVYTQLMSPTYMSSLEDKFENQYEEETIQLKTSALKTDSFNSGNEKLAYVTYTNILEHGLNHTLEALRNFVENDNIDAFTNRGNTRKIMSTLSKQEVKNIIVSECGNLNYFLYLNSIKKDVLGKKCEFLEEACIGTLRKYSVISQVRRAIDEAKTGNFEFFSNCGELNLREKLIKNVKPNEIEALLNVILIKYEIDSTNNIEEDFLENLEFIAKTKENYLKPYRQR